MRIVFTGAGEMAVMTAERLIQQGHEVILIESDAERIESVSESVDASFLEGNATDPDVLKQADPESCHFLFCVTDEDNDNIIASLLGRSLGFSRVVTSIRNPGLEDLCRELELEDTIIPVRSLSGHLENMVRGLDSVELTTLIKGDARFFTFTAEEPMKLSDADLPDGANVIYYYRDNDFRLAEEDTTFREGDEVVVLTHAENLSELEERWEPRRSDGGEEEDEDEKTSDE